MVSMKTTSFVEYRIMLGGINGLSFAAELV